MSNEVQRSDDAAQHDLGAATSVPVGDPAHSISWIPESELQNFEQGQRIVLIVAALTVVCLLFSAAWVLG